MYFKRGLKFLIMSIFFVLLLNESNFAKIYGVIKGTVVAEDTGDYLPNVFVILHKIHSLGSAQVGLTKTDSKGYYTFKNLEPGTYEINYESHYESGYCSLPYYKDRRGEKKDQLNLTYTLNSGEIKVINQKLIKGTKVEINISLINTEMNFENWDTIRVFSKDKPSYVTYFEKDGFLKIILPVGEELIIDGYLKQDNIQTINLKKVIEIIDTEKMTINLDFDFSNYLVVKINEPLNYDGSEPSCFVYKFNTELNKIEERVSELENWEITLFGLIPGKYKLMVLAGYESQTGFEYEKYSIIDILPGKNEIVIDL
jgi:hypothetical protein